ncbi:MAG: DUF4430 domain-containing protein [Vagococcus salmoninarum]|uniref:DUF4430 domain-containing protein n=1 Tax=Vagococcus salmoninarum TaxID=2739 RepID=UPI003F950E5C
MNTFKRIAMLSTMLIMSLALLVGCGTNNTGTDATTDTTSAVESAQDIEVSVTVFNEEEEVTQKNLTVEAETNLMTALQDNFEIIEDNGMITAIDGLEQDADEGFYWTYTINGEMVNTGANDTILEADDEIVMTYAKF